MRKITTTEFINRAILKHQNNFNYDKVDYVNNRKKVIITCKKHGDFEQFPPVHLRGCGCLECSGLKKKTTEIFIKEANKIHNHKFDYDKVDYVNSSKKVIITCKKHGDFQQLPGTHLRGAGCLECSGLKKKTTEIFIKEANKIHNHKFVYDKVDYVNNRKKVIIICKKHGDFEQIPDDHLRGFGCSECSGYRKKTSEKFIIEANNIHNYKFDYDKVDYVNNKKKVIITCKKHGDFEQVPKEHLRGFGCLECCGCKKKTSEKFIEEANKIHNYNFNYDKVDYVTKSERVIITCKKHGDFEQLASVHLKGCGCPKCNSSTGEKLIMEVLKKMNVRFVHQYKFEDCIHKYQLPFDFAVFIDDKIKLIEFHGEQHYMYKHFFHKKNGREESIVRDKIKLDYAIVNKIDLLVIPYTEIDNIEPLLIDFLDKEFLFHH
jgi:uncharacterized protein YcgL (UPF0745 family)